jgi:hypothetical protein
MLVERIDVDGHDVIQVQSFEAGGATAVGYQFRARGWEYSINFTYGSEDACNAGREGRLRVLASVF